MTKPRDANDVLRAEGPDGLRRRLDRPPLTVVDRLGANSARTKPRNPRQNAPRTDRRSREPKRTQAGALIEIALEVGYMSPSSFTKVFRRITGVTPMEFRKTL